MRLSQLYMADETAWLEQMSKLIKQRRFDKIDVKNLSEFLSDMAERDKREVRSRLANLVAHLLKWHYQPRKRSRSWVLTIAEQQGQLQDLLKSKTLRQHAEEALPSVYSRAVRLALIQTGLKESTFPQECPFDLDHVLDEKVTENGTNSEGKP